MVNDFTNNQESSDKMTRVSSNLINVLSSNSALSM